MEEQKNSITADVTMPSAISQLITFREPGIKEAKATIALALELDGQFIKDGIKPHVRSFGGGGGFPKKEKNFTGEICPKDGGKLYKVDYVSKKTGKAGSMLKCENSKYDFTTKTSSGCSWVGFGSSLKEIEEKEKLKSFDSEYGQA